MRFNRDVCDAVVKDLLTNQTISLDDTNIFAYHQRTPLGSFDNIVLTLNACEGYCGNQTAWQSDAGSRLLTWFLPMVVLLSNMQLSPVGRKRYLSIFHLVGNPIGCSDVLLSKMDSWNDSFKMAEKIFGPTPSRWKLRRLRRGLDTSEKATTNYIKELGMVIEAFKETFAHRNLQDGGEIDFSILGEVDSDLITKAASTIIHSKTYEIRRTVFSILLYVLQVLSAFIKLLGDGSPPSGGRIGPAMLLSWIVPIVLHSNVVGDYISYFHRVEAVRRLLKDILASQDQDDELDDRAGNAQSILNNKIQLIASKMETQVDIKQQPARKKPQATSTEISNRMRFNCLLKELDEHLRDPDRYFNGLAWINAMNTYSLTSRLSKPEKSWSWSLHLLLSAAPVFISYGATFSVLYTAPTNLTCRHFMITGVLITWILSAAMTLFITRQGTRRRWPSKTMFSLVSFKDAVLGLAITGVLVASTCGLFNNCWCWAGGFKGAAAAAWLNPVAAFARNNELIYPITVGLCFFFHICVFSSQVWVRRKSLSLLWWSESSMKRILRW